jgi:hypothetical protein
MPDQNGEESNYSLVRLQDLPENPHRPTHLAQELIASAWDILDIPALE